MSDALKSSEAIAAAGATHPRVSVDDIEASIMDEYYGTAAQLIATTDPLAFPADHPLQALTVYFLVLRNGHVAVGLSKPASVENFDPEKGRAFAREDAIRGLWPLMGYSLRDTLHRVGEVTGHEVAGIAARRMHDSDPEVRALAGSALTQAPDRPKV